MKQKLNIITRAIMAACFSLASISSFASYEEAISANAQVLKPDSCNVERCCNVNVCDSINMPVIIVDGVEVQIQDFGSIPAEDIENVEVIKDETITKIFSPRLGGVLLITTKSKRFLTPILEDYNRGIETGKQNRIPGQLLIRGSINTNGNNSTRGNNCCSNPCDTVNADSSYTWPHPYVMPSFPGGQSDLQEFVKSNLQYPKEAKQNNEHGRVDVTFFVDKDGTITAPRIIRGRTPSLDAEALRIVSIMPKWTPGSFNGELKKVQVTLPIIF